MELTKMCQYLMYYCKLKFWVKKDSEKRACFVFFMVFNCVFSQCDLVSQNCLWPAVFTRVLQTREHLWRM